MGSQQLYEIKQALEALESKVGGDTEHSCSLLLYSAVCESYMGTVPPSPFLTILPALSFSLLLHLFSPRLPPHS